MAKNKVLEAVVQLAGVVDPSLGKAASTAVKHLDKINLKGVAVGVGVAAATYKTVKTTSNAIGGLVKTAGKAIAFTTAAAIDFGTNATENAMAFQKQMSNVGTLLDGDVEQVNARLGELNKEVLAVSNTTGVVTEDLTDGLYQVISALGDTEDSTKILEIAAKSAKAGNATTTDSINLLSAVTKGYGDTSAEAQQKAADLAFATLKLGQTSFPELAASMGKAIPIAEAMNVSQEELFGATATLTGVTGNTAEVMTQLRGTMQGFMQPSASMAAAIEKIGYADGQAMLEAEGLQGALELLKDSVGGNELAFADLFGSVQAKTAVLAMTGAQADNLTEKTQAMYEAAGAADAAFAAQTANLPDMIAKVKNLGTNFMTEVGLQLIPVLTDGMEQLMPIAQQVLDGLMPIVSMVMPMLSDALALIIPMVMDVVDMILPQLLPLVEELLPPLMEVVSAILPPVAQALLAILPLLTDIACQIFPIFTDVLNQLLPALVPIVQTLVELLGKAITPLIDPFTRIVQALLPPIIKLVEALLPILEPLLKLLEPIANVIAMIAEGIGGLISAGADKISGLLGKLTGGGKDKEAPAFAAGGFTQGLSIVGEDPLYPTEAVISFNPAYHDDNIGYWAQAGALLGVNIPGVGFFAAGGFTSGLAIAGEDPRYPTEAVISFNPTHRDENLAYWARAGQMLGVSESDSISQMAAGGTTTITYDFSGFQFAPQIIASEEEPMNVIDQLREHYPELIDIIEGYLERREASRYGARDSRIS